MSCHRTAKLFLAVILAAPFTTAQVPSYRIRTRSVAEVQADQRSLVSSWCRRDYEGARLSPDGWKLFDPLTNIKLNPDFSSIYIVTRYEMQPSDHISMDATVQYTIIGRYQIGIGYTPEVGTRFVNFHFSDKEDDLQITDIDPAQPNVSKPVFVKWLKEQIAAAKTPADKLPLQNALDQLMPPPPVAAKAEKGSSSSKRQ